ncbi:MAG: hypothetical protein ACYC5G_02125 [Candidatus Doudnabacteria bacterium]
MPTTLVKSTWSSGNLVFKKVGTGAATSIVLGEDGTGLDFKCFGDTSGKYMLWDQSADKLIVIGTADMGSSLEADAFTVGGTAGVDFTSGVITSLQVIKGIVTYAA